MGITAICLAALLAVSCSRPGPIPPKLAAAPTETNDDDPLSPNLAYQSAVSDCNKQAEKQTVGTLLSIVRTLRPGAYRTRYVDCMRAKGYDVN